MLILCRITEQGQDLHSLHLMYFLLLLQDLLDFVSTAASPKMQVLDCMYIRQTVDLLQVRRRRKTQRSLMIVVVL